jgi:hypothetical protein
MTPIRPPNGADPRRRHPHGGYVRRLRIRPKCPTPTRRSLRSDVASSPERLTARPDRSWLPYWLAISRPLGSEPSSARLVCVRNPVTYFDSTVGGWLCGCGCGEEIFAGEFVRGHEQTALHQRVAQIGTIPEFLRWFDAVRAGTEPAARATAPTPVSRTGQFDLSIGEDGSVRIHFTPTGELATDLRPGA